MGTKDMRASWRIVRRRPEWVLERRVGEEWKLVGTRHTEIGIRQLLRDAWRSRP